MAGGATTWGATIVLNFEELDPSPARYDLMTVSYGGFTFLDVYYGPDLAKV